MSGDISIYPNPTNDLLYINLLATVIPTPATVMLNLFKHPTITLTNLLGQSISPPIISLLLLLLASLALNLYLYSKMEFVYKVFDSRVEENYSH